MIVSLQKNVEKVYQKIGLEVVNISKDVRDKVSVEVQRKTKQWGISITKYLKPNEVYYGGG